MIAYIFYRQPQELRLPSFTKKYLFVVGMIALFIVLIRFILIHSNPEFPILQTPIMFIIFLIFPFYLLVDTILIMDGSSKFLFEIKYNDEFIKIVLKLHSDCIGIFVTFF